MDGLTQWRDKQIDAPLGAPNSSRGKALGSMRRPWETFTRFVSMPGAPIDNNVAERVLQLFMRQRKHSLFDNNPQSAYIASVLPSLRATGLYAGVKAVDALVALPEQRRAVFVHPAAWLPWASASSRASPEATRRQSFASWARSGAPCHIKMMRARADKGPRASVLVGHHAQRPVARRFLLLQYPWPS
jgi:Transposase IS66 family